VFTAEVARLVLIEREVEGKMTDHVAPPERHLYILESPALAHVATIGPKGEPNCNPVWFKWTGSQLLFSTIKPRRKYRNLVRDNRIALSICDVDDPDSQIEIRGTAELSDDPEGELIVELALRYTGASFAGDRSQRVIVTVTPLHYTTHS
jgi:PPOX class probable F420-dependent enzyme